MHVRHCNVQYNHTWMPPTQTGTLSFKYQSPNQHQHGKPSIITHHSPWWKSSIGNTMYVNRLSLLYPTIHRADFWCCKRHDKNLRFRTPLKRGAVWIFILVPQRKGIGHNPISKNMFHIFQLQVFKSKLFNPKFHRKPRDVPKNRRFFIHAATAPVLWGMASMLPATIMKPVAEPTLEFFTKSCLSREESFCAAKRSVFLLVP